MPAPGATTLPPPEARQRFGPVPVTLGAPVPGALPASAPATAPRSAPATAPGAPSIRWRRRLATVTALAAVLITVAMRPSSLAPIVLLFIVVVPFERRFPRHRQPLRRPLLAADLAYALLSSVLNAIGLVVGVVLAVISLMWVPGLLLRPMVGQLPAPVRVVMGLLLFDLVIYWAHRLAHEVPFLWRFHVIHHSTEHLDWISGFRGHPLDGVLLAPAFVVLLAAGFPAKLSGAFVVVQIVIGIFLHANVRWRWKPLHRIIITPEFHHWHHTDEAHARNTDYSTFLPLWDLLFGTYYLPRDRRPTVYGVSEPVPDSVLGQLWYPLRGLRNPLRSMRHPRFALRTLRGDLRRGMRQMADSARRPRHVRS